MALDATLRRRLDEALTVVDDHGTAGPRLRDDARRLWARVRRLLGLVSAAPESPEADALELACYALQLPLRGAKTGGAGRTLRDRCEDAAELLIMELGALVDEPLLDLTARVLREAPHRSPMVDEARLLADAVNLDDFGVVGIAQQVIHLTRQGQGVAQLADGLEKREQYGYWAARLKEDFHFEPLRELARRRLEHTAGVAAILKAELAEDEEAGTPPVGTSPASPADPPAANPPE